MASELDCAILSSVVYKDVRQGDNETPLPPGWSELGYVPNMGGTALNS